MPAAGSVSPEITVNWIPFAGAAEEPRAWLSGAALNILLFLPLGFLTPLLWRDFCRLRNTLLLGFSFSLFVETAQLLTFRVTDVDDLIMNTAGAVLGFGAFAAITRCPAFRRLPEARAVSGVAEVSFTAVTVFLYYFFIQPRLSEMLFG